MASKSSSEGNKHSFASLLLVIVLFGSLAVMAFVPVKTFDDLRSKEQRQIVAWLGEDSDQWIMERILDALTVVNHEAGDAMEQAAQSGNKKIDTCVVERVHAAAIWTHIFLYRIGMIGMWLVFALPCLLAAFIDGYYQREIAKASFTSQSPRLHKAGVDLAKLVAICLVVWLFAPIFVSTIVAPVAIAVLSFSWWVWMANLQKRI